MRIYITGVSGLLGGNLAFLLKDRAEIHGCDRNPIAVPGLTFTLIDCADRAALRQDILQARPDALIHCAGFTSVDGCERDPETACRVNTILPAELARLCMEQGIKMVFLSSDAVYNGDAPGLHREEEQLAPCNVYGRSKMLAEMEILKLQEQIQGQMNTHRQPLILRTNFLGYNVRSRTGSFEWLLNSMQKGETVTLFEDVWFSPLSVSSLTEVIWDCLRADLGGVYNASAAGAVSKLAFGRLVKERFGLDRAGILSGKVGDAPLLARRSLNMGMDNTKLRLALGKQQDTPEDTVQVLYEQYLAGYPELLASFRKC